MLDAGPKRFGFTDIQHPASDIYLFCLQLSVAVGVIMMRGLAAGVVASLAGCVI
jgi:hypothetical protein